MERILPCFIACGCRLRGPQEWETSAGSGKRAEHYAGGHIAGEEVQIG